MSMNRLTTNDQLVEPRLKLGIGYWFKHLVKKIDFAVNVGEDV